MLTSRYLGAGLLSGDQPVPGGLHLPHQLGPLPPGGSGRGRQQGERSQELCGLFSGDIGSTPQ